MSDETMGVLQTGADVVTLEPGITFKDRFRGVTGRKHLEDVLDVQASPADDGLPPRRSSGSR